jgi:deoxyribonuclease V
VLARELHSWEVTTSEAISIQRDLAPLVARDGDVVPADLRLVAGIDVSFPPGGITRAAVVLLSYPTLEVVETSIVDEPTRFPYVPGLLSFREAPAALAACAALRGEPDLIVVDGQGIAHPRRLGIAAHLGLLLDKPTIGCAKSILVGRHLPLGEGVGATADLVDRGEVVGRVLRTRAGVKPVYVSVGHRLSLDAATRWVLALCRRYRLPEPQRQAHIAAGRR